MGKKTHKSISQKKILKALDKGLDALESLRKHQEKAAKHRDKAIAAMLDVEAMIEDGKYCDCDDGTSKSKKKSNKKKKQKSETVPASENSTQTGMASLMDSLSMMRAQAIDDLELIAGVGPKLAETLNEMGVSTYKQIAQWTEEDIRRVDERLNFPGRIIRENWVEQAKALAEGGREEYIRVFGKEPR